MVFVSGKWRADLGGGGREKLHWVQSIPWNKLAETTRQVIHKHNTNEQCRTGVWQVRQLEQQGQRSRWKVKPGPEQTWNTGKSKWQATEKQVGAEVKRTYQLNNDLTILTYTQNSKVNDTANKYLRFIYNKHLSFKGTYLAKIIELIKLLKEMEMKL